MYIKLHNLIKRRESIINESPDYQCKVNLWSIFVSIRILKRKESPSSLFSEVSYVLSMSKHWKRTVSGGRHSSVYYFIFFFFFILFSQRNHFNGCIYRNCIATQQLHLTAIKAKEENKKEEEKKQRSSIRRKSNKCNVMVNNIYFVH